MSAGPPGNKWRVLAHAPDATIEVQDQGVFDELVVDDWLHVEQLATTSWYIRVGDARLHVEVRPDGPIVDVARGFYAEPRGTTTLHVPELPPGRDD
jgi:hypothetical protein